MRGLFAWAAVVITLAVAEPASAQVMPGKAVGVPSVQPVGTRLPTVGTQLPRVGQPPGAPGNKPPESPFTQGNWPTPDPNLVIAPYPTPKLDSGNFWDRLYQRWLVLFTDDPQPTPNWVPGISRRNRERREKREEMLRRQRD